MEKLAIISFRFQPRNSLVADYIFVHTYIVMHCAIWHHLYNLKNVRNTRGGVLLLVKMQAKSLQRY